MKSITLADDVHERQLGKMTTERRKVAIHLQWLAKARGRGWAGVAATTRETAEAGETLQRERLDTLNTLIAAFENAVTTTPRPLFAVPDPTPRDTGMERPVAATRG
jgi:hypothetical protein